MIRDLLIGIWKPISWTLTDQAGHQHYPFGVDVQGVLIYTPEGYMSVHLMKANRSTFQSIGTVFDVTLEQALDSYQSYVSYCGLYEMTADKILHHVTMHTNPNWIGTTQVRPFKMDGDLLHLSHPLEHWHSLLIWQKIKSIA
jgi:hypothetical protein